MSEFDSEIDDDQPEEPRGLRKQIEEQAAKAREAEARAAAAERELAFAKAGLDLSDPKIGYFARGYQGEISADAIRAEAENAGFLGAPAPEVSAEELQQHQQVANLAASGTPTSTWNGPLHENPQYKQEMYAARTPDEAMAVMAKYGSPVITDLD